MDRPLLETELFSNRRLSFSIEIRSSGFKVASHNYFNYSVMATVAGPSGCAV